MKSLGRETPFQLEWLSESDQVLLAFRDALCTLELNSGSLHHTLELNLEALALLSASSDSTFVAVADSKGLRVLDAQLRKQALSQLPQAQEIQSLIPLDSGAFLSVNEDSQVSKWNWSEGEQLELEASWPVECKPYFARSKGASVLCSERGRLQDRDCRTGTILRTWSQSEGVNWACCDPQGQHCLTLSDQGQASLWDLSSREALFSLQTDFSITRAYFHSSGLRGALLGLDGEVSLFEVVDGGSTRAAMVPECPLVSLCYSNGDLLGLDENGGLYCLRDEQFHPAGGAWAGWATSTGFMAERNLIGTANGSVEVFGSDGTHLTSLAGVHHDAVVALEEFDGKLYSLAADASLARITELETEPRLEEFASFPGRTLIDHCFCPHSKTLCLALDEGMVCWFALTSPEDWSEIHLEDRRIEEIRPAGVDQILLLTDRGSVKLLSLRD